MATPRTLPFWRNPPACPRHRLSFTAPLAAHILNTARPARTQARRASQTATDRTPVQGRTAKAHKVPGSRPEPQSPRSAESDGAFGREDAHELPRGRVAFAHARHGVSFAERAFAGDHDVPAESELRSRGLTLGSGAGRSSTYLQVIDATCFTDFTSLNVKT